MWMTITNMMIVVKDGGVLVESMPFDRRVAGSNPDSRRVDKSFTYSFFACKLQHNVNCCGRERYRKAHAVRSAIEMG